MEERLISYLLGELSEQDQVQLESEYFGDKEKFDLLQVTRDELMDAYADGKLSEKQRKQFEVLMLDSPGRRHYLDFAEALTEHMSRRKRADAPAVSVQKKDTSLWESIAAFLRARNFALQLSLAAIAVIALFGSLWLMLELSRLKSQINQLEAQQKVPGQSDPGREQQIAKERERAEQLSKELSDERSKRIELEEQLSRKQEAKTELLSSSLAFILMPDLARSEEDSKGLVVPPGVSVVEFQLGFNKKLSFDTYQAQLSNGNGDQVWNKDGLKIQKKGSSNYILLKLPAKILAEGDYTIELRAAHPGGDYETVSAYSFKILRK